jgi:RHS repeat-associated protein
VIRRSYQNGFTTSGTVYFDGSDSYAPDGSIVRYNWRFPQYAYDVSGSSTATPSCRFTAPGTYICRYRVLNNLDVWSQFVNVNVIVGADTKTSCFGYNWDINYNLKVVEVNEAAITFFDGQNHRVGYSRVNGSKYIGPAHISNYFLKEDGLFTLYEKGGIKYKFDSDGCLNRIEDLSGNAISFSYIGSGLYKTLTTITDDLNRNIGLTYNSDGLLWQITDFTGRTWTYTYDSEKNNLLSVTTPATSDDSNGLTTAYTYNSRHNLKTITDANGQVWLANSYDSLDRVETQTIGDADYVFNYDPDNSRTTVIDRKGNINTVYYDSIGNTVRSIDSNSAGLDDPCSFTTAYEYNPDTEKVSKILFPKGNWAKYEYDNNGNILRVIAEPNNGDANIITSYTYEPNFDFVATITDAENNVTTFDYNESNGSLISITYPTVAAVDGNVNPVIRLTYNEHGQVGTIASVDGIKTQYIYYDDSVANDPNCGRLWKIIVDADETEGLNITAEYKYDIYGNVTKVKDTYGNVTELAYNQLNQMTQTKLPTGNVTKLSYNVNKMLAQIEKVRVSGANQTIKYTYNRMDKLQTATDPLSNITVYGYDNSENLSDVEDAEHHITYYEYDKRDMLSKTTDAGGNVTQYSYTPNGQLAKIIDANGNQTAYYYDGFDRLKWVQYPDDTNEVYSYDKNSNVISLKDRSGRTTTYEYDALNRLTEENWSGNQRTISCRYDIADRIYDVNDNGLITKYSCDRISRIIDVNDVENRLVKYEYDKLSRRTRLVYPDDTNITYEYDTLSRLTKIKYQGNTIAEYSYDEFSRRTLLTYGNDTNSVYEYDLNNRLTKLANNNFTPSQSITFEYDSYDKVDNRLNVKSSDVNAAYTYDEIYRLISVNYSNGNSTGYIYDCLSNWVEVDDGSIAYFHRNNLNQYISVGGTSYSYDLNGNLTNDGVYKYYYDCENRLTDVNDQNNNRIASCKYDYLGRRIEKKVYGLPDIVTKFCYDGDQVIAEYENGSLVRKFIYGTGIDEPICMIDVSGGNAVYYYHFDGLGSVAALSNNNGNVVEQYSYSEFGTPSITSSIGNRFMFTGREYDSETGLYYYRARFYKPSIGRFLQTDPIGYSDSMNLYQYCGSNPIGRLDPYGLDWFDSTSNFCAGMGDHLSFGATGLIRKAIGVDSVVDRTGTAYKSGVVAGIAYDVVSTGASLALQRQAAKIAAKELAKDRSLARKLLGLVKGDGKIAAHLNPLKGHPGGARALFPTAGLPSWIKNNAANLRALKKAQHLAAHGQIKAAEKILQCLGIGNEWITGARTAMSAGRLSEESIAGSEKIK